MKTGIYQIRNIINDKRYIGSAASIGGFDVRWGAHFRNLRHFIHVNSYLQNAWNKYGEKSFIFEILELCKPELCLEREQYYLDAILFASCNDKRFNELGYNICRKADSPMWGRKHTKVTKAVMSKKASGNNNPMYNKPITDEHRERLIKARVGKKFSKQHRENLARSIGRLNENDVLKIRQDLIDGVTVRKLFEDHGVTKSCIMSIKHRRTWRHI